MTVFSDSAWRDMGPPMWMARVEARILMNELEGRDVVITSGRRAPTPGGSSLHAHGLAMDIRSRDFGSASRIWAYANELQSRLGEDFDVIVEGPAARDARYKDRAPHIHIEYDPKGRHASKLAD